MVFSMHAGEFVVRHPQPDDVRIRCTLRGSLSFTGREHATDRAVTLGLHGWSPGDLAVSLTEC